MLYLQFHFFVFPGDVVRDVDAVSADVEHGQHVGFEGIADHEKLGGMDVQMPDKFLVIRLFFLRHDFDVVKKALQARLFELALLIEQVAFGGHNEAVAAVQGVQHFLYTVEQFDGFFQQFAPVLDALFDDIERHGFVAHAHGRFDHGEHKTLDAVAVQREVLDFGAEQFFRHGVLRHVVFEQAGEFVFGFLIVRFVDPEGVVGVEGDDFERHRMVC